MALVKPQDFGEDSREEGGAAAVPSEGTSFWRRFVGGKGGGQQLSLVKPQKSSLGGRLLCFPRVFSTADRSSGH